MRSFITFGAIFIGCITIAAAQGAGWPRAFNKDGAVLIVYQPQVDEWTNFSDLSFRFAFTLTPPAGKQFVGVAVIHGTTAVDPDDDLVTISPLTMTSITFPSLDPGGTAQMSQLVRAFLPPSVNISLRRLIASSPKKATPTSVELRSDPPAIFVSYRPAILLYVEGKPQYSQIPDTKLEFVVNTPWPVFFDRKNSEYFLLVDKQWMTAGALEGPWTPTSKLPRDMDKLPHDPQWAPLKSVIPPPKPDGAPAPTVFFSMVPGEVVLFDGPPQYSPIPGTELNYAVNTTSDVFFYNPAQQFYYLCAGRWFSAPSLQGPWTYATPSLPTDFMHIPPANPAGRVLASVPGTEEAKDAVLLAQVPTTLIVDPAAAASQVSVTYFGEPQFAPIEGTSLLYATNTEDKVIQVGNVYYLCLQGVWFSSATPQGPWATATVVPQEIYTIPPSSPVYNVTYVTQNVTPTGSVQASYTTGYLGAFIAGTAFGAIVVGGTGYYYPPYVGVAVYGGYPAYVPYAGTYGVYASTAYTTAHGAYGVSHTAYGAYGSATSFAQYNPYTGTYARGASVSTPYGSRSAAQAYNPYTGRYAAHASGSSPTAQWGSSVISGPGGTTSTQHITTAQGSAGAIETSAGGRGGGVSTAQGDTLMGKAANGDLYADHNGNVYRNTGNGWQQYQNGSWNNVNKSTSSPGDSGGTTSRDWGATGQGSSGGGTNAQDGGRPRTESSAGAGTVRGPAGGGQAPDGLNQEFQNRERGSQQSQRFEQFRGRVGGRGLGDHRR
jgi:hypothetical protein